jgi:Flp pilus assembly protein TadD
MDWDLMSFPGIFITLFGILSFLEWCGGRTKVKNHGLILIAVSLFHTVPWILVNADGSRSQKAEEILKQGIRRNPNEMGCYSYLGEMLHNQGRDDEAIPYLRRALLLKPESTELRFNLGRLYLNIDLEKSIFHLEKVKAQYEHEPPFVIGLAKAYLKAERPNDARAIVQRFLAKGQETATMRGLLGASLFLLRDSTQARVEWERALELNPAEPLARTGLKKLREIAEE